MLGFPQRFDYLYRPGARVKFHERILRPPPHVVQPSGPYYTGLFFLAMESVSGLSHLDVSSTPHRRLPETECSSTRSE